MTPIRFILSSCVVVFMTGLVGPVAVLGADATSLAAKVCPGLNYQGDKCECKPGAKCEKCPCGPCVGGEKCACIKAVRDASGTITGQIAVVRTKVKTTGSKSDKDVVVYLVKVGANDFPPPIKNPRMDQKGLVFIPHVIAVQRGATVEFLNNDNDKHNVYFFDDKSGKTKDLGTWQPGESRNHVFAKHHEIVKKPGKNGRPDMMIVLCKLHLEMAAYIVILDNPFFTTAAIDAETQKAKFTLKNVPPGKYKLNVWHKKLRLKEGVAEITVEQGKSTKIDLEITKEKYAKK